jgi:hypothetical protein
MHKSQKRKTRRVYNSSNPLQTEEPGIGNDGYYSASAVSPNAHHQDKKSYLFTIDCMPNQYLMLHRHWRIHILRNQRANNLFLIVLHRFGTNMYIFLLGNWRTIAMKLIYLLLWQQFNILRLFFRTNMMKSLTMNPQMTMMSYCAFRTLQRPPSSQTIFLERFLTVQLSTGHLKCAMILGYVFVHVQSIPDHGGKTIRSLLIMTMNARWVS